MYSWNENESLPNGKANGLQIHVAYGGTVPKTATTVSVKWNDVMIHRSPKYSVAKPSTDVATWQTLWLQLRTGQA